MNSTKVRGFVLTNKIAVCDRNNIIACKNWSSETQSLLQQYLSNELLKVMHTTHGTFVQVLTDCVNKVNQLVEHASKISFAMKKFDPVSYKATRRHKRKNTERSASVPKGGIKRKASEESTDDLKRQKRL
jgi:uncharacterized surface anchored protein